jgi:hypothetical protein
MRGDLARRLLQLDGTSGDSQQQSAIEELRLKSEKSAILRAFSTGTMSLATLLGTFRNAPHQGVRIMHLMMILFCEIGPVSRSTMLLMRVLGLCSSRVGIFNDVCCISHN